MKNIIISVFSLLIFISCNREMVQGNGEIVTETRTLKGTIEGIELYGSFDVIVNDGPYDGKITLTGESNILDKIQTDLHGTTLSVSTEKFTSFSSRKPIKIILSSNTLNLLKIHGSGDIHVEGVQNTEVFISEINGSGDISASLNVNRAIAIIHGSGDIKFKGQADTFSADIYGSGDVNAFDLNASHVLVSIRGSGDVKTTADKSISGEIRGSGSVKYKGNAKVNVKKSGSGSLINRN